MLIIRRTITLPALRSAYGMSRPSVVT